MRREGRTNSITSDTATQTQTGPTDFSWPKPFMVIFFGSLVCGSGAYVLMSLFQRDSPTFLRAVPSKDLRISIVVPLTKIG